MPYDRIIKNLIIRNNGSNGKDRKTKQRIMSGRHPLDWTGHPTNSPRDKTRPTVMEESYYTKGIGQLRSMYQRILMIMMIINKPNEVYLD